MKFKKLNIKKLILFLLACISVAILSAVINTNIKATAFGRNGNWNIYNSDAFLLKGLDKIFTVHVKNDPNKPDGSPTHMVKEYMDLYNQNYNSYSIVNSLSDGKPIGDPGIPEVSTDPQISNEYLWLNTTLYNSQVSAWYNSTYGPLIDSEVGNPSETSQEEDSTDFASLLFPEGSDRVYVASTQQEYYLRDAKATATLYGAKYPILLSNSQDSGLAGKLSTLKTKHAIFLGGTGTNQGPATFDGLTGIGTTGTDMVRIGGTNYAQTARFVKQLPTDVYDAPEQPENNLNGKYSLQSDGTVDNNLLNSISQKLQANDFTGAVKLALSSRIGNSNPRSETNVQSGMPALVIGGFDGNAPPTGDETDKTKEKYLKIYLCNPSTGQIVFQYFTAGFKFVPSTTGNGMINLTVRVSPRDAGTVTIDGKASKDGSVTKNKQLVDGKANFSVTQSPSTQAPSQSHWEFDHWGVMDGDNVTPDSSGNVTITKNTTLIAYYKLILDGKDPIYPDESSTLTVNASAKASWFEKDETQVSNAGAAIAKEGQLVTFTINTKADDYRYPISDSRGWQDNHTPSSLTYNQNGFYGILYGQGEESHDFGHWHHHHDDDYWVSHWEYRQNYKGTVYRKPVQYFSPTELHLTFPDGLVHTNPTDRAKLNSAIKDDLNVDPTTPYLLHYITSNPTYTNGSSVGQIWKNNSEKVEFYVPMTAPITIRQLPNGGEERIRDPYKVKVDAIEPSGITATCYVNLDIRGNIYQNIYDTPIE